MKTKTVKQPKVYRKKGVAMPTNWPAALAVQSSDAGNFDTICNNEEAWHTFFVNRKNINMPAFKALTANFTLENGFMAEHVKESLAAGAEFRTPVDNKDGEKEICPFDSREFQPIKYTRTREFGDEEGGSFFIWKADDLAQLKEGAPNIYEKALAISKKLLEGQKPIETLLVIPTCRQCHEELKDRQKFLSGYSREAAVKMAIYREVKKASDEQRNTAFNFLGLKRKDPQGQQPKDRNHFGNKDRHFVRLGNPHPDYGNFHGAKYFQATVEILEALEAEGKIPSDKPLEFVAKMSNEDMVNLKTGAGASLIPEIGRNNQADQIRRLASQALVERQDLRRVQRDAASMSTDLTSRLDNGDALKNAPVVPPPATATDEKPSKSRKPKSAKPAASAKGKAAKATTRK